MLKRVAIVGYGLIGGSIGLALRQRMPAVTVVPVESNDSLSAAAGADLIVLAAPVSQNLTILESLDRVVPGEALVTDTGSTKAGMVAAAERLPARLRFVGGHPIAGSASGGLDAARLDLFDGRRWILTPTPRTHGDDLARLRTLIEALGATVHLMDATHHDRLLAYTSHLPQLAASALMHVVGQAVGENGLEFAGPGLRDSTRLASSPAPLWRDIVTSNRDNVNHALDTLIGALQDLRTRAGTEAVDRIFTDAARWKQTMGDTE